MPGGDDRRAFVFGVGMAATNYQLLPQLSETEFAALKADIAEHGVRVPIVRDIETGAVIDGHHRLRAVAELRAEGVAVDEPAALQRSFSDEDTRIEDALKLNLQRRHMSRDQLQQIARELRGRGENWTTERIGRVLGVTHPTVLAWAPVPDSVCNDLQTEIPRVTGKDGKSYPTKKKPRTPTVLTTSDAETKQAAKLLKLLGDEHEAPNVISVPALKETAKTVNAERLKNAFLARKDAWDDQANRSGERWQMRLGDFREVLGDIEPGTIDAIVTDPPYPDEFLPLWGDLARFAADLLRPGAVLIAYSGQMRLREVLNHLCGPLRYGWTLCLDLPGTQARFRGPNVFQTWKPVIVCSNGQWGPHDWFADRVMSPKKDQDLYEWQQHPEPVVELLNRYVPPGGLVLDPFAGVGSFGVAALQAGRRFIGVELDEARHVQASERLAEVA